MSVELIPVTSREQWLKARQHDVTASAVAALFGKHKYQTALELYLEKTSSEIEDAADSSVMRRGRWLEPAVAAAAVEVKGWHPIKANTYYRDRELRLGACECLIVLGLRRRLLRQRGVERILGGRHLTLS